MRTIFVGGESAPGSLPVSILFFARRLQVQVSIRRIQYEKAWSKVEEMQANDVVFEGPVIAVNRGGAIVLVEVSCLGRVYWALGRVYWAFVLRSCQA